MPKILTMQELINLEIAVKQDIAKAKIYWVGKKEEKQGKSGSFFTQTLKLGDGSFTGKDQYGDITSAFVSCIIKEHDVFAVDDEISFTLNIKSWKKDGTPFLNGSNVKLLNSGAGTQMVDPNDITRKEKNLITAIEDLQKAIEENTIALIENTKVQQR